MRQAHITRIGQGTPLVLFHGWGFDSQIWRAGLPELATHFEVFCVDLPGFGLSPLMEWETFKSSVLNQLPPVFALGGWSLGGLVATRLVLEASHRVSHLINIASSPYFIQDACWPGIPKKTLSIFGERLVNDAETVIKEFLALQLRGQKIAINASPTVDGLQMTLNWLLNWDFRDDIIQIRIPSLYLFGRLDAIVPSQVMELMKERYPHFQYLLFNKAAHALFLSHNDLFIQTIKNFLL
jgi:pimeloyl-[acyl-carrier protein] methyl ester esterase